MDLREAIIRTVCYFDLFDFPLTRSEICEWLYGARASVHEVDAVLATLIGSKILKEESGFVSLFDRNGLPAIRASRHAESARKWRRARRWSRIFAALPAVELVGVGNTLAYDNARAESDIDFFIVTAPGAIWRTRFFCAAIAALFNLRPLPNDNRDKLCLSFFVTTDSLDMQAFAIRRDDIYMHYWTRQMLALAGNSATAELFQAVNHEVTPHGTIGSPAVWRWLFSPLALLPGSFMRDWQKRHFPQALIAAEARHDGSVIVSDAVLKFHVNDRRADIYDRWQRRVKSILT
jgi:hypothetical protein